MATVPDQNAAASAAERAIPGTISVPTPPNPIAGTPFGQRFNAPPVPGELIIAGASINSQFTGAQFTGAAALTRAGINPTQPSSINQQAAAASAQAAVPGNSANNKQVGTISNTPPPGPTSFIGQIPFFLNAILSTPAGALPKGPLWVVVFEFDNNIKRTIKKVKDYEPRMPEPWEIDAALETVTSSRY